MYSFRSWEPNNDRLSYAAVQRAAAILEGSNADADRANRDRDAVPADFRACTGSACAGISRGLVHGVSGAGLGHDECLAKCVCQLIVVIDPIKNHG